MTSGIDASCDIPLDEFVIGAIGRYLKVVIESFYGIGAGWQYFNVDHSDCLMEETILEKKPHLVEDITECA